MKMLSVRLKGSFSLSHLTAFSTNIKTHSEADTQFTEVVYTGRTISSDVWMTVNSLNNIANAISGRKQTTGRDRRKLKGNIYVH